MYRKIGWRLIPVLLFGYMIAYLDRVNIGYAQLGMKKSLPWGDEVYALGAGIFFVGYLIFEVPSNLLLVKIGARKTLLRIMVLWGLMAAGMMFVTTPTQFYIVRFLLGACEAGFFPGVILYFTFWYPSVRRGQVIAIFMTATSLISIAAGPLSGATLKYMEGMNGWHGWQWLFLVQGLPATILGVIIYVWLDDRPAGAKWLSDSEKALLNYNLEQDASTGDNKGHSFGQLLRDPKVYAFALVYFLLMGCAYTIVFWKPTLIQSGGVADLFTVGLLSAIPNMVGVFSMVLFGRSSDKLRDRRLHFGVAALLAACGLWMMTMTQGNLQLSMAGLSLTAVYAATTPLFWAAATEYLPKASAAGGIALISSLGAFGPSVAPSMNAALTKATGNGNMSMYVVAACYVLAAILMFVVVGSKRPALSGPRVAVH
ncbi:MULTISPECIES: MFS transporter [unclassified Variovorax]|uniref:MFS transporter n=1 Tax=Variovorax sp. dw_954 TaxID=2720078 RepID=UPI00210D2986|nr:MULTISPECIES: MFS transporter [unclassified Variovorax]